MLNCSAVNYAHVIKNFSQYFPVMNCTQVAAAKVICENNFIWKRITEIINYAAGENYTIKCLQ